MPNSDATPNPNVAVAPENGLSSESAPLKTGWDWILTYAVMVITVGILALVNPIATGVATGILLAAVLLLYVGMAIAAGLLSL